MVAWMGPGRRQTDAPISVWVGVGVGVRVCVCVCVCVRTRLLSVCMHVCFHELQQVVPCPNSLRKSVRHRCCIMSCFLTSFLSHYIQVISDLASVPWCCVVCFYRIHLVLMKVDFRSSGPNIRALFLVFLLK